MRPDFGLAALVKPNDNFDAAVFEIERVRVTLRAVADDRNGFLFEIVEIAVAAVVYFCHDINSEFLLLNIRYRL